eukprot:m51a1_g14398 hypothetical protein (537) ;mRNA; r:352634-355398
MSFAAQLLDGYDPLAKRTAASLEGVQGIASLFKHLSEVVEDFAQKTEGVIKKYNTKKHGALEGTVKMCVETVVSQFERLAGEQHGFAANVGAIGRDMDSFAKERDRGRKKLIADGEALAKSWDAQQAALRKAKENYHKLSRDAAQLQLQAQKKETDPRAQAKPKDIQALARKVSEAVEKARGAEEAYSRTLRETNEKQRRYYTEEQPAFLRQYQTFEEERIQFCKTQVEKLLSHMAALSLPEHWKAATEVITASATAINVATDIESYAASIRTGVSVPEQINFEAPEGGIPAGTSSTASSGGISPSVTPRASGPGAVMSARAVVSRPSAQWGLSDAERSSLGDDEKRRKLGAQLEEIDQKMASMQHQIAAGEKLVQMYAKDPQGKKQAEEKLAEDGNALAELKKARELVQKQLDEVAASGTPSPAASTESAQVASSGAADTDGLPPQPTTAAPAPTAQVDTAAPAAAVAEGAPAAAEPEGQKCTAVYDYHAENETELELKEGDVVYVTEKDESGWWYATQGDKQGFIPANYVKPVE